MANVIDPYDPRFSDPDAEVPGFPEHGNEGNTVDEYRIATPEDFVTEEEADGT